VNGGVKFALARTEVEHRETNDDPASLPSSDVGVWASEAGKVEVRASLYAGMCG
jgi:hypothetical protein